MSALRQRSGEGGASRLRPSHTTVRTGPYTAVREVALTRAEQGWETERSEVRIGKPSGEGSAAGKIPWTAAAAGRVPCSPFRDPICDKSRAATPWCLPLAPQSGPQSQPDPTSKSDQHLGRLAKAEIAAPAPHIGGQFFHCRLDADALGLSRDFPDSLSEAFQGFRRDRALDAWTSGEAEPEKLPLLRSCHRTLRLIYLELELL